MVSCSQPLPVKLCHVTLIPSLSTNPPNSAVCSGNCGVFTFQCTVCFTCAVCLTFVVLVCSVLNAVLGAVVYYSVQLVVLQRVGMNRILGD